MGVDERAGCDAGAFASDPDPLRALLSFWLMFADKDADKDADADAPLVARKELNLSEGLELSMGRRGGRGVEG